MQSSYQILKLLIFFLSRWLPAAHDFGFEVWRGGAEGLALLPTADFSHSVLGERRLALGAAPVRIWLLQASLPTEPTFGQSLGAIASRVREVIPLVLWPKKGEAVKMSCAKLNKHFLEVEGYSCRLSLAMR
jgi:hypothetical protein